MQKILRRRYVAQLDSDDERTELEDINQFKVVSHTSKSDLEKIYDNVKENVDLIRLKNIEFNKLNREDQNKVEESVYAMMEKFKNAPLELDNTMPKDLYTIVENKWHYCLKLEKEIKKSILAQVMPEFAR